YRFPLAGGERKCTGPDQKGRKRKRTNHGCTDRGEVWRFARWQVGSCGVTRERQGRVLHLRSAHLRRCSSENLQPNLRGILVFRRQILLLPTFRRKNTCDSRARRQIVAGSAVFWNQCGGRKGWATRNGTRTYIIFARARPLNIRFHPDRQPAQSLSN